MLTQVLSLVDQDVKGMLADVRTRNADGELRYTLDREHDTPRLTKLIAVEIQRKKHHKTGEYQDWLYWKWEPVRNLKDIIDCGHSGVLISDEETHAASYYIDVLEGEL